MFKKLSKLKLISILAISIIAIVIVSTVTYFNSKMNKINKFELPKTNEELGIAENVGDKDIINIALFGIDARNINQKSRSDSMMILTLDKKNKKVKVTSLMRDMYVDIPGHGGDKLTHAYAYGGPTLAIKTINKNFELDIRDFVTVNFFGLEDLIDSVGGVRINVTPQEAKVMNDLYIPELNKLNGDTVEYVKSGDQILNGRQAVAYCRVRYTAGGDYERTERQRRVLNEVFLNLKSLGGTKIFSVIQTMLPYVQTSMTNTEIISLAKDVVGLDIKNMEELRIPVDGTFKSQKIRGMFVLSPDMEQNKQKIKEFIYGN